MQGRSGLDGQLVARDVRRTRVDDAFQGAPPARVTQAGYCIDEVAVDRREARLAHLRDGGESAVGVVHPPEEPQRIGLEALDPDADAIDSGLPPHPRPPGRDARRVRLHGDLGIGRDREGAPNRRDEAGEQRGFDERRGATTDEHGVERQRAQAFADTADLGVQRPHIGLGSGGPGNAGEVAVLALPFAERDVQVERAHVVEHSVQEVASFAVASGVCFAASGFGFTFGARGVRGGGRRRMNL